MEKKINIAELLKDCPNGMELYSTIYGTVYFERVRDTGNAVLIDVTTCCNTEVFFYPDGKFNTYYSESEMTLFPSKDVRTWEGFQRPFKDGDIVVTTLSNIAIIKKPIEKELFYVYMVMIGNYFYITETTTVAVERLATEEEKQKLFDAIKANGYKWNAKTKTLEKLPKFKVGNRIRKKGEYSAFTISHINYGYYFCGDRVICDICDDGWELVPDKFDITTLKPFYQVLVRDNDDQLWTADLFSFYNKTNIYPFACVGHYVNQCIPYEGNEHLLGTTNDCDNFYKTWE